MANELKPVPGTDIKLYDQAVWNRSTVADGNRLQAETLMPISANDRILASAIQGAYDYTDECFNALSADFVEFQDEVDNEFQETYQYINNVSGDLYNDIRTTESTLNIAIQNETANRIAQDDDLATQIEMTQTTLHDEIAGARADLHEEITTASAELQGEIDALEAATDVVDVVNTLDELEHYSKKITKDDIIKILDASGTYDSSGLSAYDFSGEQVYVRYNGKTTAHPLSANWTYVGKLEPYYNTSYIDAMYNNIEASALNLYNTIDETSSTLNDNIDTASSTLNSKLNDVYAAKFSANTTEAGNIVSGFYISGGQGVTVTTADNNNNKGIYISAEGRTYSGASGIIIDDNNKIGISATYVSALSSTGGSVAANANHIIKLSGVNIDFTTAEGNILKISAGNNGNYVSASGTQSITLATANASLTPATMANGVIYLV